jgi:FAD:protein FMN transferase
MSLITCLRNKITQKKTRFLQMRYCMGTFLTVEVATHASEDEASKVIRRAFEEARRLEGVLSRFRSESEISRINQKAFQKPQPVSAEVFQLLKKCVEFNQLTGGVFNMATASLTKLWRRCAQESRFPVDQEIQKTLCGLEASSIVLDDGERTVCFREPSTQLDLGAVGKGYALDRMIDVLWAYEVEEAVLDFGGNIYYFSKDCKDRESQDELFGIVDPTSQTDLAAKIQIRNQAMSTSASYERHFKIQGKTFSHILDPRTGCPASTDVLSATVISSSAQAADMLSTTAFTLGAQGALALVEDFQGAEIILVTLKDKDSRLEVSSGLEKCDHSVFRHKNKNRRGHS